MFFLRVRCALSTFMLQSHRHLVAVHKYIMLFFNSYFCVFLLARRKIHENERKSCSIFTMKLFTWIINVFIFILVFCLTVQKFSVDEKRWRFFWLTIIKMEWNSDIYVCIFYFVKWTLFLIFWITISILNYKDST